MNGQRPFITTDSTFPGSGALGAGLITDLLRSWDNLEELLLKQWDSPSTELATPWLIHVALSVKWIKNFALDGCNSQHSCPW